MLLAQVVDTSAQVTRTRSRLTKTALFADLLRSVPREQVGLVTAYLVGDLPQGKIGVGYAALRGLMDVGAANAATLTLQEVDGRLTEIKETAGAGSTRRRNELLGALLARATAPEQAFIAKLIIGELRQGALEGLVLEGVAQAFVVDADAVRRAAMLAGALPPVAEALCEAGAAGLTRFALTLFQPVQPMLADTAEEVEEPLARWGEAALEYKLDGARVQVHKDGDRVEVYTRALHRVTAAVPEVVERVRALPASQLILDGETIAFDTNRRPLPFQVTMRRFGRKLDVESLRQTLPLDVAFFDVLRVERSDLLDAPLHERWRALCDLTAGANIVPRITTADPEAADAFYARALAEGHEGVMVKALHAGYRAGRRGQEWLKYKSVHTMDLVVLAAEWGSGRREGWLSNLHLGARDPHTNGFVMLGKTFKGMTDELLRWQTDALLAREIGREGHIVHVRPELVVEVAFNDVQKSPYPGGVALRFARIKRYRSDKPALQANTLADVIALLPKT